MANTKGKALLEKRLTGKMLDKSYKTFLKAGNYDTKKGYAQSRKHEDHTKDGNPV